MIKKPRGHTILPTPRASKGGPLPAKSLVKSKPGHARSVDDIPRKVRLSVAGSDDLSIQRRTLSPANPQDEEASRTGVRYITEDMIKKVSKEDNLEIITSLNLTLSKESGKKFKYIENLEKLKKLQVLNLSNNVIEKLEKLSKLIRLRELNLSFNCLTKIEGLETLTGLQVLNLTGNQIQTVPLWVSKKLRAIRVFKIAKNNLQSLQDVTRLKSLPDLSQMTTADNPVSDLPHCRAFLLFHLRTIEVLDGYAVTTDERDKADERFRQDELDKVEKQLEQEESRFRRLEEDHNKSLHEMSLMESTHEQKKKQEKETNKRVHVLEQEMEAKNDLLKKKTAELNKACEKHYQLEQELAFFKIDSKFDTLGQGPVRDYQDDDDGGLIGESPYIGRGRFRKNEVAQESTVMAQPQKIEIHSLAESSPGNRQNSPAVRNKLHQALDTELEDKKMAVTKAEGKLKRLQGELNNTEQKISKATTDLRKIVQLAPRGGALPEDKKRKIRQRLAKKMLSVNEYRDDASQLENEMDNTQRVIHVNRVEMSRLKGQLQRLDSKDPLYRRIYAEMVDKEQQISESSQAYSDLQKKMDEMLDTIAKETQEVKRLEQQLNEDWIEQNESLKQELEGVVGGIQGYIQNMETQSKAQKEENQKLIEKRNALEERVKILEQENSTLDYGVADKRELEQRILEMEQSLQENQELNLTLQDQLNQTRAWSDDPQALERLDRAEMELDELRRALKESERKATTETFNLEQQLQTERDRNQKLARKAHRHGIRSEDVKRLTAELNEVQNEKFELENQLQTERSRKLPQEGDQLSATEDDLRQLVSQLEEAQMLNDTLQQQISEQQTPFEITEDGVLNASDLRKRLRDLSLRFKSGKEPIEAQGEDDVLGRTFQDLQYFVHDKLSRGNKELEQAKKSKSKSDAEIQGLANKLKKSEDKLAKKGGVKKEDVNKSDAERRAVEAEMKKLQTEVKQLKKSLKDAENRATQSPGQMRGVDAAGSVMSLANDSLNEEEQDLFDELQRELMSLKRRMRLQEMAADKQVTDAATDTAKFENGLRDQEEEIALELQKRKQELDLQNERQDARAQVIAQDLIQAQTDADYLQKLLQERERQLQEEIQHADLTNQMIAAQEEEIARLYDILEQQRGEIGNLNGTLGNLRQQGSETVGPAYDEELIRLRNEVNHLKETLAMQTNYVRTMSAVGSQSQNSVPQPMATQATATDPVGAAGPGEMKPLSRHQEPVLAVHPTLPFQPTVGASFIPQSDQVEPNTNPHGRANNKRPPGERVPSQGRPSNTGMSMEPGGPSVSSELLDGDAYSLSTGLTPGSLPSVIHRPLFRPQVVRPPPTPSQTIRQIVPNNATQNPPPSNTFQQPSSLFIPPRQTTVPPAVPHPAPTQNVVSGNVGQVSDPRLFNARNPNPRTSSMIGQSSNTGLGPQTNNGRGQFHNSQPPRFNPHSSPMKQVIGNPAPVFMGAPHPVQPQSVNGGYLAPTRPGVHSQPPAPAFSGPPVPVFPMQASQRVPQPIQYVPPPVDDRPPPLIPFYDAPPLQEISPIRAPHQRGVEIPPSQPQMSSPIRPHQQQAPIAMPVQQPLVSPIRQQSLPPQVVSPVRYFYPGRGYTISSQGPGRVYVPYQQTQPMPEPVYKTPYVDATGETYVAPPTGGPPVAYHNVPVAPATPGTPVAYHSLPVAPVAYHNAPAPHLVDNRNGTYVHQTSPTRPVAMETLAPTRGILKKKPLDYVEDSDDDSHLFCNVPEHHELEDYSHDLQERIRQLKSNVQRQKDAHEDAALDDDHRLVNRLRLELEDRRGELESLDLAIERQTRSLHDVKREESQLKVKHRSAAEELEFLRSSNSKIVQKKSLVIAKRREEEELEREAEYQYEEKMSVNRQKYLHDEISCLEKTLVKRRNDLRETDRNVKECKSDLKEAKDQARRTVEKYDSASATLHKTLQDAQEIEKRANDAGVQLVRASEQLEILRSEVKDVERKRSKQERLLREVNQVIASKDAEFRDVEGRLKQVTQHLKSVQTDLTAANEREKQTLEALRDSEDVLIKRRSELARTKDQVDLQRHELEKVDKAMGKKQTELQILTSSMDKRQIELASVLRDAEAEIAWKQRDLKEHREQIKHFEVQKSDLMTSVNAKRSELQQLKDHIDQEDEMLQKLLSSVNKQKAELKHTYEMQGIEEQELENLRSQHALKLAELEKTQHALIQTKADLEQISAEMTRKTSEVERLRHSVAREHEEVDQLKVEKGSLEDRINALSRDKELLDGNYKALDNKINHMKRNHNELEDKIDHGTRRWENIELELHTKERELEDASLQKASMQKEIQGLKQTVKDHRGELKTLKSHIQGAEEQVTNLQEDLHDTRRERDEFKVEIERLNEGIRQSRLAHENYAREERQKHHELQDITKSLDDRQLEYEDTRKVLSKVRKDVEIEENKLSKLISTANLELDNLRADICFKQDELDEAMYTLETIKHEAERRQLTEDKFTELEKKVNGLESDILERNKEKSELSQALKRSFEELQKLRTENSQDHETLVLQRLHLENALRDAQQDLEQAKQDLKLQKKRAGSHINELQTATDQHVDRINHLNLELASVRDSLLEAKEQIITQDELRDKERRMEETFECFKTNMESEVQQRIRELEKSRVDAFQELNLLHDQKDDLELHLEELKDNVANIRSRDADNKENEHPANVTYREEWRKEAMNDKLSNEQEYLKFQLRQQMQRHADAMETARLQSEGTLDNLKRKLNNLQDVLNSGESNDIKAIRALTRTSSPHRRGRSPSPRHSIHAHGSRAHRSRSRSNDGSLHPMIPERETLAT